MKIIRCNVHVETLSQITREQADKLIADTDGHMYFDAPVSGIAKVDYPLTNPDVVEIKEAWSVGELLWDISQFYKKIYEEENETTKKPVTPSQERGLSLNRNKTNGIHGIWGHDIGDLRFEEVTIKDDGTIELMVGS